MILRFRTIVQGLTVLVLCAGSSLAAAQSFYGSLGLEADEDGGRLLLGAIGGRLAARSQWDLGFATADTSRDFAGLRTSAFDGSLYHDFGRIGLRVGLGRWQDNAVVTAEQITGSLDLHGAGWSLAFESQFRTSDFEPLEVQRTIVRRDGSELTIDARADCAIDDLGLGARLRPTRGAWTVAASAMRYDYDAAQCVFDLPGLEALRRSTRAEFMQFADRLTLQLTLGAGRRLLARTALLDSRAGVSLAWDRGARIYNVYLDRLEDAFFGQSADTLSAGISFPLGASQEFEAYAGVTALEAQPNVSFVGLLWLFAR